MLDAHETVLLNVALQPAPAGTVSGTVTDASGHGWPLYATVTVDGVSGAPAFTDPATGRFSITLPEGSTAADVGQGQGTVTTDGSGGVTPLAGSTVEIDSRADHHTLRTDRKGGYASWLDRRDNPLTVIVAKDGYRPQTTTVRVKAARTVTRPWTVHRVAP